MVLLLAKPRLRCLVGAQELDDEVSSFSLKSSVRDRHVKLLLATSPSAQLSEPVTPV